MTNRAVFAGFCVAVAGLACTVTRHGTLERLPAGPVIPVSISVQEEAATVVGTDPQTGERLEGVFHVSHEERPAERRGMVAPVPPMGGGAGSPGVAPPSPSDRRSTIEMVGHLEGSKGTSAKCTLQIFRGLRVRGSGDCRADEGDDQHPTFRIRF